jgi:hypothetical protein
MLIIFIKFVLLISTPSIRLIGIEILIPFWWIAVGVLKIRRVFLFLCVFKHDSEQKFQGNRMGYKHIATLVLKEIAAYVT